jgi:hypothetical protein
MVCALLDNMERWRHFPSYQLERRADVLFSLYLVEIIERAFGNESSPCAVNPIIIPEFPLRKLSIRGENNGDWDCQSIGNRSWKADYFLLSKDARKAFLIELKTDMGSRNDVQDDYLHQAQEAGIKNLVEGVLALHNASAAKRKYRHLIEALVKLDLVTDNGENNQSRGRAADRFTANAKDCKVIVVYIQPKFQEEPCHENRYGDKKSIEGENCRVIDFQTVANVVRESKHYPSPRFADALIQWAKLKAGEVT